MHYIYVIKSVSDRFIYKGLTNNLERRIGQHNTGMVKSTKHYLPFKLVYCEECKSREQARTREKYFKSGFGREIVEQIIDEMNE